MDRNENAYDDDIGDGGGNGLRGVKLARNIDNSQSCDADIDRGVDLDDDRAEVDYVNSLGLDESIYDDGKR